MPDVNQLERLLKEGETSLVEFKASPANMDAIRRDVCAFANDLPGHGAPGYIFVGVDDKGQPTGLRIDDQLQQQLAFVKDDGKIQPLPHLTVERVVLHGTAVAVVTVWPSIALPVRLEGQVWIRTGTTRDRATLQQERILTERDVAATLPFDQRPCAAATKEDLDLGSFQADYLPRVVDPAVLLENHRTIEYKLASFRFFHLRRGVPTHAGVLAFGKDPLNFLPGAYIQFVRYDGPSRAARVLDHKTIKGKLKDQLLQLDALLPAQIHTPRVPGSGLKYEDRPDYPLDALREFVLNAVMHRSYEGTSAPVRIYWYAGHVEIQSPGGLYGEVTESNFEDVNDYRNPVLAEVLKGLGYVDRYGRGIVRAQAALRANGNPPAQFTFQQTHVLVRAETAARSLDVAAKGMRTPPDSPAVADPEGGDPLEDATEEPAR